ncbi:alpha-L-fucosidase, partial [human gut metagenome]
DPSLEALPTDERLRRAAAQPDPGLDALYFQYGRWLLFAASRPGSLPANLQGVWNDSFFPPWDSKYTININTEMNYWPANICGLAQSEEPLFDLLARMVPNGQRTARELYHCRGFVAHHNTDLWGDTDPQDRYIPASFWPMGAAWLCTHIWRHYLYSGDMQFLRAQFPMLEQAVLF